MDVVCALFPQAGHRRWFLQKLRRRAFAFLLLLRTPFCITLALKLPSLARCRHGMLLDVVATLRLLSAPRLVSGARELTALTGVTAARDIACDLQVIALRLLLSTPCLVSGARELTALTGVT